jgi:hypothetical protein
MVRKTRNLLTAKLKRPPITRFEEFKKHNELRPKQLSTVSFHNPAFFLTLANTLKAKVGDVVGCIFEVECSVGGFLILKQIILFSVRDCTFKYYYYYYYY